MNRIAETQSDNIEQELSRFCELHSVAWIPSRKRRRSARLSAELECAAGEDLWALLRRHWLQFSLRIIAIYFLTVALSTVLLILLDRWPILSDPHIALRRTIFVSFPAVFSAMIVDSWTDTRKTPG